MPEVRSAEDLIRLLAESPRARGRHPAYDVIIAVEDGTKTLRLVDKHSGELVTDELKEVLEAAVKPTDVERASLRDVDMNLAEQLQEEYGETEVTAVVELPNGGRQEVYFSINGVNTDEAVDKLVERLLRFLGGRLVGFRLYARSPMLIGETHESIDGGYFVVELRGSDIYSVEREGDLPITPSIASSLRRLIDEEAYSDTADEDIVRDRRIAERRINYQAASVGRPPRGMPGKRRLRLKLPSGRRLGVALLRSLFCRYGILPHGNPPRA